MNWNKNNKIYYGGDYNPDQWDREIWNEDMAHLKAMDANMITLPVFSWAKLQPSEDSFDFGWLDDVVALAQRKGIFINMATPTAAQPAWMSKKYPEMLPVDTHGQRRKHGGRSTFCPNNKDYRRLSRGIALKMAAHYAHNKHIALWHVNNEYGTHCFCENCHQAFIQWLKDKYGTLENLNEKWYTNFWGHTYYDWDEIQVVSAQTELLPGRLGNRDGTNFQGMALDYFRFMSDSIVACYKNEADAIKSILPEAVVTTNIWGVAPWLDLHKVGEAVDVVSWDSYPGMEEHYSVSAFKHDVIRSLKADSNFILMEQTPNQQNWQAYNTLKRPGVMALQSYQAIAHGSDAVLFFQVRQSRGACEKYHAALIPHAGHLDTRIGRELTKLGHELTAITPEVLGTTNKAKVAMVMDWDNWRSVEYSSGPTVDLNYFNTLHRFYQVFNDANVAVDIIRPESDMTAYTMVVAPLMNMVTDKAKANIEAYVSQGGCFISTYFSGYVDEHDLVHLGGYPGALKDVMGIWVEEVDALHPEARNQLLPTDEKALAKDRYDCGLICEVIHLEGAKALATYGTDFYEGTPAVTENLYGQGKAVYIGTEAEADFLEDFLGSYMNQLGIQSVLQTEKGVEVTARYGTEGEILFVMNHNDGPSEVIMDGVYKNLIQGEEVKERFVLEKKGVAILKKH